MMLIPWAHSAALGQIPTTIDDFFQTGTQPDASGGKGFVPIRHSWDCATCHEVYGKGVEAPIYSRWRGSMMANSVRDPLFHACLTIANQDAAFAGDLCLRCHAPGAWLGGRSNPTDGSHLTVEDEDGITCNFCHRLVDPVFRSGISPREDRPILLALSDAGLLPLSPGGGNYVVDPHDVRRGPFRPCATPGNCNEGDVPLNLHFDDEGVRLPIIYSAFHASSQVCATCHDVSNPAYLRQDDGSYALDTLGLAHPTQDKYDMFPLERTYSEWANSDYATVGVDAGGVFGGNHPTGIMRTCQDCHMPDTESYGSGFQSEPFFPRPNTPAHDFSGGSTWMQSVLGHLYPYDLPQWYLADSIARSTYMLHHAATLEFTTDACSITIRVINETGHKLPSGYPEGRRMWLSVEFQDAELNPVVTRGEYDFAEAELVISDTKVYEAQLGLDRSAAALAGKKEGPSFHFALNNKVYKDNRIPPRGFNNKAFEAVQAQPVGAAYEDGQYWDETTFRVPPQAVSATVTLYYQTASKEYITFLRDENRTNNAGTDLYHWWQMTGMSPPTPMRSLRIHGLSSGGAGDSDCDGDLDLDDWHTWASCPTGPEAHVVLGCESFDEDIDGDVDLVDLFEFQNHFAPE